MVEKYSELADQIKNKVFKIIRKEWPKILSEFIRKKGEAKDFRICMRLDLISFFKIDDVNICENFVDCISYEYLMGKISLENHENVHIVVYKISRAVIISQKRLPYSRNREFGELFQNSIDTINRFLTKKSKNEELFLAAIKFLIICVQNAYFKSIYNDMKTTII